MTTLTVTYTCINLSSGHMAGRLLTGDMAPHRLDSDIVCSGHMAGRLLTGDMAPHRLDFDTLVAVTWLAAYSPGTWLPIDLTSTSKYPHGWIRHYDVHMAGPVSQHNKVHMAGPGILRV